jgi:ABC-2 type transport system permease protein
MRAAVLICLKDLKARLRDRSALLIGIVVPLGLAFIFNSIFSGISGNSKAISLGVVNADRGAVAQQFVGQVLGAVGRSGLIAVHPEPMVARARALAAKGTLSAVIVIPAGFTARVLANRPASMQVIGNVDAPVSSQIARSIAEGYAAGLNRVRLSVATVVHGGGSSAMPPGRVRVLAARAAAAAAPVAVRDVSAKSKELDQKSFFAAGMAVFFLFFTVQFGVTSC